jgi:hypothetical protein
MGRNQISDCGMRIAGSAGRLEAGDTQCRQGCRRSTRILRSAAFQAAFRIAGL